jgi:hypothetical protein
MSNIRTVGAVVLGIALCGLPLSLQRSTHTVGVVAITTSTAHAAELDILQSSRPRTAQRRHAVRISRLCDPYCGGPYTGSGYNGGTYYGGPWIDLRCFEEPIARPLRSSAIPY